MNMSALTKDGNTAFNVATKRKDYAMMEFLHMYGVKVNSADAEGRTALHVATSNNDIDGICRLIEWGSDIDLRDHFVQLGGKHASELEMEKSKISAKIGTLNQPKFMRKSTSLTRMKKLPVPLP